MDNKEIAEGVAFTFFKKNPNAGFLKDEEIESLKEIIVGYLDQGKDFDYAYQQWRTLGEWTK